eukprot:10712404-Alexandrium_andersonii.AAC.1
MTMQPAQACLERFSARPRRGCAIWEIRGRGTPPGESRGPTGVTAPPGWAGNCAKHSRASRGAVAVFSLCFRHADPWRSTWRRGRR